MAVRAALAATAAAVRAAEATATTVTVMILTAMTTRTQVAAMIRTTARITMDRLVAVVGAAEMVAGAAETRGDELRRTKENRPESGAAKGLFCCRALVHLFGSRVN